MHANRRRPGGVGRDPVGPKKLVRIGAGQLTPQQERIAERRRDQRDGVAAQEDENGQLSGATETDAAPTADVCGATGPVPGGTE
jgi:hypothetical protein